MDSVLLTSPGNSTRIKSRLRIAAAKLLTRNTSKNRHYKNHTINHRGSRSNLSSRSTSTSFLKQLRGLGRRSFRNGKHEHNDTALAKNTQKCNGSFYNTGIFTREVYNTICGRLGRTPYIPGDSVQTLFNDMHLYPSKSQVTEMLQCARQCGRRNGASPFLTFGEFCVFAREMQRPKPHRKQQQQLQRSSTKQLKKCDVFLGGSCNPTTWRLEIAIPELQKHGISYYNPQKPVWGPELVAEEHDAKQSASVLLFVVDSQTRSVSSMIEVAYLVASDRCVVIVTHSYELGQSIMGEELSYREYLDLDDGQSALLTLLKMQKVKVHGSLTSALHRTTHLLQNCTSQDGIIEQQITNKLRKLKDTFDLYDEKQTGELHLNEVLDAYYRLTNKTLQLSDLYNYLSLSNNSDTSKIKISFEQFCALVAEYSSNGCPTFIADDWASRPLHRQCSTNNNINCDTFSINLNDHTSNKDIWYSDIYLGGSSQGKSMWRENIAIPLLKKHGLTYYNPAMREADAANNEKNGPQYLNDLDDEEKLNIGILQWKRAMDTSKILLFVVTNDTRSLSSMILAAHYIGLGRKNVVLCIQQLPSEDCCIGNETITKQAAKDYNRGRVYLSDIAKRSHLPVFDNIAEAVQCAIDKCQSR